MTVAARVADGSDQKVGDKTRREFSVVVGNGPTRPQDRTPAGRTFGGACFFGAGEPLPGEGLWTKPKNDNGNGGPTKKNDDRKTGPPEVDGVDTSMMHIGP
ncbi:Uncharacterised protein [Candidatus Bilamarchaeum dharawalense]|uniref:Uncharacterized protein n=1 Tax=Candidatus Bilamarchaeum dharawalense TaxID=2885759 RepID=A0A5E4LVQ1_9ARCH|nr:Uncharacterised protein [Candidatus Bilamarchaeum dharawalense]